MKVRYYLFLLILSVQCSGILSASQKREMRAVWIATVSNIDWPSSPNLTTEQQKAELILMLDKLAKNNINTVVFQVRPTADAFYMSRLEPWSKYLTGTQGQRPQPYYDPLEFLVSEAHRRCMEVHVWLNPYRTLNDNKTASLSDNHLYHQRKDLFVNYGGKYYFDPGLDDTRSFLNQVVKDIVERYDIDAIHFDDYFYPYPVNGQDFPDNASFKKYPRGFNNKADWRRNNVNMVISELQQTIKSAKPWVEFGISPFGVWRNNNVDPSGSATRAGIQNYDDLYADILKWLREGTIDYVVPQLYWEIGKKVADYEILAEWWSKNSFNKNLYIGLYASALEIKKEEAWQKPNELARQLRLNQQYPQISGAMFFSTKSFLKNLRGLNDSLQTDFYRFRAICPENNNLQSIPSEQPQNIRIIKDSKDKILLWDRNTGEGGAATFYYVVYAFKGKKVGNLNDPGNILTVTTENYIDIKDKEMKGSYTFVVTSVNRFRKESVPTYGITRRL